MISLPSEHLKLIQGPDWYRDPYPAFKTLRQRWPVARIDWPQKGAGDWLISRASDVRFVLSSESFSIDRSRADSGPPDSSMVNGAHEPLFETVLTVDAPRHSRLRKPLNSFLSDGLARLEPRLFVIADELLKSVKRPYRFDLVGDFAAPFAELMVGELIGLMPVSLSQMGVWSRIYVRQGFTFGRGFVSREVHQAVANLKGALHSKLLDGKDIDRSDFFSTMRRTDIGPMTDQQIINVGLLLVAAGMQTTKHAIANTLALLIEHADGLAALGHDDAVVAVAVEECLRYDGPSQAVGRVASLDTELSGLAVPKGAFVRLALASANRDDRELDGPDTIILDRRPHRHFAFGLGRHSCVGAQLARIAVCSAVRALLRRFKRVKMIPGGQERELHSSLRGYSCLKVIGHC